MDWTASAVAFAGRASTLSSAAEILAGVVRHARAAGVGSVSLNLIAAPGLDDGPCSLVSRCWNDWENHYQANDLQRADPALRMLLSVDNPFTWRESLIHFPSREAARVLDACADLTGARDGLVIPVRTSRGVLMSVTFSGSDLDLRPEARAALWTLGLSLAAYGAAAPDGLAAQNLHWLASSIRPCPLSPRHVEILSLVVEGLTDDQISDRLRLSANTIHSHMAEIRRRVGVTNRMKAAFLAQQRGWL